MSSFALDGANATLAYRGGSARVRVSDLSISFSLNATESQARRARAFYPHQRSQGSFSVVVDCNGWRQVDQLNAWLLDYFDQALGDDSVMPPLVEVIIPARNFHRFGLPYDGVKRGDHVGSMVFSPRISFISVSDPSDPSTAILTEGQASSVSIPGSIDPATNFMYPTSVVNDSGAYASYLYDTRTAQGKLPYPDVAKPRDPDFF